MGRTGEVHNFFSSFPDSVWKSKENAWKLQLMAVNQILPNIYGILMLWRKQSGYFFLLLKFLGSCIDFFFFFSFFLFLLLLFMLYQRRAANTLALIVPHSFTFWFCFTLLFPRKTWKSYYTSVESLSEILACSKGNWHPIRICVTTCGNSLIALNGSKKAGWDCSCVLCAIHPLSTQGVACCAVMTFYVTIFESRNVNTIN